MGERAGHGGPDERMGEDSDARAAARGQQSSPPEILRTQPQLRGGESVCGEAAADDNGRQHLRRGAAPQPSRNGDCRLSRAVGVYHVR